MSDLTSTSAARVGGPRWLDVRVVLGVLLLLVSVLMGSWVVNRAERTSPVLVVDRTLGRGHVLTDGDLRVVRVRLLETGSRYYGAGLRGQLVGGVLTEDVAEGELLPRSAVATDLAEPLRRISLAVPLSHAGGSDGLAVGDRVDVYATISSPPPGRTELLVQDVRVVGVDSGSGNLGTDPEITVTMLLPPEQVLAVINASQVADLDLVEVVLGADGEPGGSPAAGPSASPAPAKAPAPARTPTPAPASSASPAA